MSLTKNSNIKNTHNTHIVKKIESTEEGVDGIKGLFEVSPLRRGFGTTLGNALRRVCLAHLEGTAVIGLRIPGLPHEFSAIEGVFEDSVELILNLKKVAFSTESKDPFVVKLESSAKTGELFAKDLILPTGVEVVNPEAYIATITEEIDFFAEFLVSKGKGYVLSEEHSISDYGADFIPLDSVFMPIKKFSYQVEQIRIGESSEASSEKFEKLLIEVVSNGSIKPEIAIREAARELIEQFAPFLPLNGQNLSLSFGTEAEEGAPTRISSSDESNIDREEDSDLEKESVEDYSAVGIETLHLSVRAYNCLKRAGINTVKDLRRMSKIQLLRIRNFGSKSAEEIEETLEKMGLSMASSPLDSEDLSSTDHFNRENQIETY